MSDQTQEVVRYDAAKPPGNSKTLSSLLSRPDIQKSLAEVAANNLTPERLAKMMLMAASRQPRLLECTQLSLIKAAMTSAELGLDCSGTLGRAYIVPYGKEATFIPGYLGLADLARRSGEIESLDAQVVYRGEKFALKLGLEPSLVHEPDLFAEKKDEDIVGAYFVAKFKAGGNHIEWMNRADIEKIRRRSKAANNGPWVTDYAAMCRKTVLRRGIKFCPLSVESQNLISKAEEDEYIDIPSRHSVERGSLNIEDLQSVDHSEEAPAEPDDKLIDIEASVLRQDQLTNLWNQYLNDLKKRKASKACLDQAKELLGAEYGTTNLGDIEQQGLADVTRFQMFLARCTTDLEKDDFLK